MVCSKLGVQRNCRTATTTLPGCREPTTAAPDFLDAKIVEHLFTLYGSRATPIIDLAQSDLRLREPLAPGYSDIAAQVVHSIRNEQCVRATDFLLRRTLMGYSPDQGCSALPALVARMGEELSWSDAKMEEEIAAHMRWIQQTKAKNATDSTDYHGF